MKKLALALVGSLLVSSISFADTVTLSRPLVCTSIEFRDDGSVAGIGGGFINLVVWNPIGENYQSRFGMIPREQFDKQAQKVTFDYLHKGILSIYDMPIEYGFIAKQGQSFDIAHAGQPVTVPITLNDDGSNELKASGRTLYPVERPAEFGLKLEPETSKGKVFFKIPQGDGYAISMWGEFNCWNTQD